MRRRLFLSSLCGAAAAWPFVARAQQPMRRIGVLMPTASDQPVSRLRLGALLDGLKQLGWIEGRNLRLEIRWAAGNPDAARKYAQELIALGPEVILAGGNTTLAPLLQL